MAGPVTSGRADLLKHRPSCGIGKSKKNAKAWILIDSQLDSEVHPRQLRLRSRCQRMGQGALSILRSYHTADTSEDSVEVKSNIHLKSTFERSCHVGFCKGFTSRLTLP